MKLINNNISPLPFYDDISFQNHRKDYAFGNVYPLMSLDNVILPFQFMTDKSIISFSSIRLFYFDNPSKYIDITKEMVETGFEGIKFDDFSLWKYPGIFPINSIKYEGLYYIGMLANNGTWLYSDVFSLSNRGDNFLMIEYYNSYNFKFRTGIVDFSNGFKFRCYLPTQIGKPEYVFEEESTERMGYSFIESQVSKKVYKFSFVAPEYLCDALRIIRLCDNKRIVSKKQEYILTTFNMKPTWEDQGDLASVECSFETDTVIANLGGYKPVPKNKDFNSDFNSDFK